MLDAHKHFSGHGYVMTALANIGGMVLLAKRLFLLHEHGL